ncbi:substrate-binding domain-containing protein [Streptacidiphilus albus]|uniref:substrate-binding domain-containing protein n=1 Tax=Streptacidiphilus albus TaxID=105425 RepID=UPI0009DF526C|nr:substrate-binding domain-containing protein [Streptacidiphilus albus]
MLAAQRQAEILAAVRRDGVAKVADLSSALGASEVTIRRDIETLAADGRVRRVHGGAVLPEAEDRELSEIPGEPTAEPVRQEGAPPVVGMLVPKSAYYFKDIVEGVRAELAAVGGRLLLAVSEYDAEREADLVRGLLAAGADGLLLAPASADLDGGIVADWATGLQVPTVLVERRAGGAEAASISWVRSAHEDGAAAAVRHLHGLGHQRIGLFVRGDTPTSFAVRRGWLQAAAALELPAAMPVLTGAEVAGWPQWGADGIRQLAALLSEHRISALLCHSDEDALALLQNGLTAEFAVPADLSLVAYDDEFSEFTQPPLTAVSPAKRRVGQLAVRTLLETLGDPSTPVAHIEVQPRLVRRDSCAPVPPHAATPAAPAASAAPATLVGSAVGSATPSTQAGGSSSPCPGA